jgi:hypothetical protein
MAKKDPRVDEYIEKSAEFARPILKHFRRMVHTGCPDVEETTLAACLCFPKIRSAFQKKRWDI